jgi:hypothetical protein
MTFLDTLAADGHATVSPAGLLLWCVAQTAVVDLLWAVEDAGLLVRLTHDINSGTTRLRLCCWATPCTTTGVMHQSLLICTQFTACTLEVL